MSAAISWGTTLRTPHGECDCPECVEARGKIREAHARLRAEVPAIPPRAFELLALEAGTVEPQDPWLRNMARVHVVQRWVELGAAELSVAEEELAAAISRAVEAREELVARCEVAEVTLHELARVIDLARPLSPWAAAAVHDVKSEGGSR